MNIRDRRAIHHAADERLAASKADAQKVLLIYVGIITVLSLAIAVISTLLSDRIANTGGLSNMGLRSILSTGQSVLPLLQSVVALGLEIGYCTAALRISRGESISSDTLFGGFRRFFPMLRSQLLMGAIYLGIVFLCMYPSCYIFLLLPISNKFYEVATPLMESASMLSGVPVLSDAAAMEVANTMLPMFWIFGVLFLLVFIPLHYRYRLVVYRIVDQPRPGAMAALRESRTLMRRNRFALFRLDLSFWWFYLLQGLVAVVCYGDLLLPMVGIRLPWSGTVNYFLFMGLSLVLQTVVYYFFMNRVAVAYAVAYEALLPKKQEETAEPQPTAVPWQNQY